MSRNLNHASSRPDKAALGLGGPYPLNVVQVPHRGQTVYFDTETFLISQGLAAPPLVCLTYAIEGGPVHCLDAARGAEWWRAAVRSGCTFVAHSLAFDLGVMVAACPDTWGAVWEAVVRGRTQFTVVREKLRNIAWAPFTVGADLSGCIRNRWGWAIGGKKRDDGAQDDPWRLRYNELADVPLESWPESAVAYACDDVAWTRALYIDQQKPLRIQWVEHCRVYEATVEGGGEDELRQTAAAWAFAITGAWGLRTDPERTDDANRVVQAHIAELKSSLIELGVFRPTGKLDTKALQARVVAEWDGALGPVPLTDKGAVKTDKDTLQRLGSPVADALLELRTAEKTGQFLSVAGTGTRHPICAGYNVLVLSGRSSCRNPNLQQMPRKGGVRECFIARPGSLFLWVDYDSQELRTWAQVTTDLFGAPASSLRARYADDPAFDPHLAFACQFLRISYAEGKRRKALGDKEIAEARQFAKIANFGYVGGMSAKTLVDYARTAYGMHITLEFAKHLRDTWMQTWAEGRRYLEWVGEQVRYASDAEVSSYGGWTLRQQMSNRLRAGCSYTNGANSLFQGRAADGAKDALVQVVHAMTNEPESPLYTCRATWFIHDEIGSEVPRNHERASAAADEQVRIMEAAMQKWHPAVPVRASATLANRWSKKAESTRVDGLWTICTV